MTDREHERAYRDVYLSNCADGGCDHYVITESYREYLAVRAAHLCAHPTHIGMHLGGLASTASWTLRELAAHNIPPDERPSNDE